MLKVTEQDKKDAAEIMKYGLFDIGIRILFAALLTTFGAGYMLIGWSILWLVVPIGVLVYWLGREKAN